MDPAIIAGGLKLLGGLFGKKKKAMTPQQSIESTAAGARSAAEKYGFNALTLLAGSNATAGAGMDMGGTPPLASLSVLGDIVEDQFGDEANTRREHNKLQNELLQLEVDRARTLNVVAPPTAVGGASLNGGYAVGVTQSPVSAPFLDEDMRGEARVDERDGTASIQSHGQETVVPIGPDADEVVTGFFIDAMNRSKASKARLARAGGHTVGQPLTIPEAPVVGPFGVTWQPDFGAVLPPPPSSPRPKPRSKKPRYSAAWIQ